MLPKDIQEMVKKIVKLLGKKNIERLIEYLDGTGTGVDDFIEALYKEIEK